MLGSRVRRSGRHLPDFTTNAAAHTGPAALEYLHLEPASRPARTTSDDLVLRWYDNPVACSYAPAVASIVAEYNRRMDAAFGYMADVRADLAIEEFVGAGIHVPLREAAQDIESVLDELPALYCDA